MWFAATLFAVDTQQQHSRVVTCTVCDQLSTQCPVDGADRSQAWVQVTWLHFTKSAAADTSPSRLAVGMANATAIARLHADPLVLIPTSRALSKASVRPWGIRRRALRDKCERPPLTLRKMGANGEQVPRLFDADADVVQFWGQLDGSVLDRLRVYAKQKPRR